MIHIAGKLNSTKTVLKILKKQSMQFGVYQYLVNL